jgi:hypothetical protein
MKAIKTSRNGYYQYLRGSRQCQSNNRSGKHNTGPEFTSPASIHIAISYPMHERLNNHQSDSLVSGKTALSARLLPHPVTYPPRDAYTAPTTRKLARGSCAEPCAPSLPRVYTVDVDPEDRCVVVLCFAYVDESRGVAGGLKC